VLDIVIATHNRHKFRELKALFALRGIRWRSLAEFPLAPHVKETGRTFDANATKKARAIARATGLLALADDSGIEVQALAWEPGVRSARFAGGQGDDKSNNEKLLKLLGGLHACKRMARYRCSLALASPLRLIALAHGTWNGRIATRPIGTCGFGYDPIFVVPRYGKTVGQLPAALKRRLSHRARAARRMRPALVRLLQDTHS
jgi:XTP/dITP diphosphohydrolase